MKYKIGDEVLVKAKIINSTRRYFGVEVEDNRFDVCEDDIVPATDMTPEEAWETAGKIYEEIDINDICDIFGTSKIERIMKENAPQQAKSKIEAWEAEKDIKVGDVVINCGESCIVTNKSRDDGFYDVLFEDGTTGAYQRSSLKKTSRYIDIGGLLKQIGGNE